MPEWFRKIRIRSINLFGVEVEFDHATHPPEASTSGEAAPLGLTNPVPKTAQPPRPVAVTGGDPPQQPTLTVFGEVVGTIDQDLGIRVRNEEEIREFWRIHEIDTMLDWFGKGPPVFSIGRNRDRELCKPGDQARMTVVVQARKNGKRGIKTIDFEVISG
ncbi:hypothetical protein TA3x_004116 [Tundrisphaera sp. TA3]|uniref:hypothetical protein n=1 Tax=Tundrisphaera sp. TA3 TaxID=3435775 RepID=UPI003EBA85C6